MRSFGLIICGTGQSFVDLTWKFLNKLSGAQLNASIDVESGRSVVIGRHRDELVMLPFDRENDTITPVTVHVTTRQQVNFRLKMEGLVNE